MTLKTTQLRDAITFALAVGTTGFIGMGAALAQETPADQPTTLDRIEVTGSRIRQVDLETAAPVLQITARRHREAGLQLGRRHPAEHHRRRFAGDQPHLAAVLGRSRRRPVHRPAQPRPEPHPDPGQRQAPGHHQRRPAGRRIDPGRDGRAHRSPEGRRLHHLRFRRHRRRGEHHHPQELRRRRSQRLLSASTARATARARSYDFLLGFTGDRGSVTAGVEYSQGRSGVGA